MKNYTNDLAAVQQTANEAIRKLRGKAFNELLNEFHANKELRAQADKNLAPILKSRGIALPRGVISVFIDNNWSVTVTVRKSKSGWSVTIKFSSK